MRSSRHQGAPKREREGCRWTKGEDARLAALWPERTIDGIARTMRRTMRAVSVRALKLRLGCSDAEQESMREFETRTGYGRSRIFNACARLGIVLERSRRMDPRQRGRTTVWSITDEQSTRILEFLAVIPDGRKVYSNQGLRTESGVWGVGIKPRACSRCGTVARPHCAKGMCSSCYHGQFRPAGKGGLTK